MAFVAVGQRSDAGIICGVSEMLRKEKLVCVRVRAEIQPAAVLVSFLSVELCRPEATNESAF